MSRWPIRSACGAAAARWLRAVAGLAAVEADHRGDAEVAAGGPGFLEVIVQGRHLGQRVVPPPGLEQQLAQGAVRLGPPHRRADLAGQLPGLPGRGQRLVVPVEVAEGDGLVDLQQQPQVGQPRIGLGHGQRPVEQRQRVGHVPLHAGHDRQHVQCPGHGPVVGRLRGRLERAGGDPARLLDLAEVQLRARGEHQQPGAVPGRDPGRGQRPVQGGQRLRGRARQHAALRQRPVQVLDDVGLGGVLQRAARHLLGLGQVADAVEGVGEPAGQPAVPGRDGRGTGDGPGEKLGGDPGRLVDQRVRGRGPASRASTRPSARARRRARRRPAAAGGRPGPAGAPASARARPASRCQAARTGAGISSYSAARISGCRNPSRWPDSASTPTAHASSMARTRSATLRSSTMARSVTVKSTPSRAAARSTSRTGPVTKPSRSAIAADSEPGAVSPASSAAPALGDGQAGAAGQRGDELGDVQRVARRPVRQLQQPVIGPAARQRRHQVGHRRPGQPVQLQARSVVHRPAQRQQVLPQRRPHHPDQQQRHLPGRPGQPSPQRDAGRIRPLQVIDHQHDRAHRALLGHQRQQLLGQHRRHV